MRYVAGGDLKALLATSGPLDAAKALSLLTPIALALDAAHANELVHRDVKPGNILIQRSPAGEIEHVYLTDFGIAKSSSISGLTRAGGFLGTVEYMAPEQVGGGAVGAQTDVYALAGVFYECVTGRIPFERELAQGILPPTGPVEPISAMRPELPAALDGVMAKALSRDPADRYATCEQFLNACSYVLDARTSDAGGVAGATVAEAGPPPAKETAGASERWPETTSAEREPVAAGAGDAWPPMGPPPPIQQPPPVSKEPDGRGSGGGFDRRRWVGVLVAALLVAVVAVVLLTKSSSKNASAGGPATALAEVPTNHVTGSGSATVKLNGDIATVTLTTNGLAYDEALGHALHIHGGGKGQCPPASAARQHNGHLSISTTDGINYYGAPVQALTTSGDTSTKSILTFSRYPTGGTIRYTRTINLPPPVVAYIRQNNAVIVVHGTDYDHSGIYSGVLDRSELNKSVPGTATAPALCGVLSGPQKAAALNPRARSRAVIYTASLLDTAAQAEASSEFNCQVPEVEPAVQRARRRTSTGASAQSAATVLG
jgi:hypothetical protein